MSASEAKVLRELYVKVCKAHELLKKEGLSTRASWARDILGTAIRDYEVAEALDYPPRGENGVTEGVTMEDLRREAGDVRVVPRRED